MEETLSPGPLKLKRQPVLGKTGPEARTMKVRIDMTAVASVMRENAAHSQSEALVLMCSCAFGGFRLSAALPSLRTSHCGTNIVGWEEGGKRW